MATRYFCEFLYSLSETHSVPFMPDNNSQCTMVSVCYKQSRKFFFSTLEKQSFMINGKIIIIIIMELPLLISSLRSREDIYMIRTSVFQRFYFSLVHVNKPTSIISANFLPAFFPQSCLHSCTRFNFNSLLLSYDSFV